MSVCAGVGEYHSKALGASNLRHLLQGQELWSEWTVASVVDQPNVNIHAQHLHSTYTSDFWCLMLDRILFFVLSIFRCADEEEILCLSRHIAACVMGLRGEGGGVQVKVSDFPYKNIL